VLGVCARPLWVVAAILLLIAEVLVPGAAVLLCSRCAVGAVAASLAATLAVQIGVFASLVLVSLA
jgi:membrane protein implicated in regulation of membrane protease activity